MCLISAETVLQQYKETIDTGERRNIDVQI